MSPNRKIIKITADFPMIIWKRGDFVASKVDPSWSCEARGVYTTEEIIKRLLYSKTSFLSVIHKQQSYFR
jgi:hypothetical protein